MIEFPQITCLGSYVHFTVGRVLILFSGGIIMCVALILETILAAIDENHQGEPLQSTGIAIICFCAVYVIGFAYSWGPVVWVVCAEMFPMRERGKANSLSTFSVSFFFVFMSVWQMTLELIIHTCKHMMCTYTELVLGYHRRGRIPSCFHCIISRMLRLLCSDGIHWNDCK